MPARLPIRISAIMAASAVIVVALMTTGCGVQAQSSTRASDPTPTTAHGLPTPGALGSSTPSAIGVTIVLDRQRYTPGDVIHVTVFNGSATGIAVAGGKAACTIAEVQQKTAQGWQKANVIPCADAEMSDAVSIAPGATYTTSIATRSGASFIAAGSYRLALSYSRYTVPPPRLSASLGGHPMSGGPLPYESPHASPGPFETAYSPAFTIG